VTSAVRGSFIQIVGTIIIVCNDISIAALVATAIMVMLGSAKLLAKNGVMKIKWVNDYFRSRHWFLQSVVSLNVVIIGSAFTDS
jgi:hypothetical protein